ncbi:DUF4232 domain-containing protein [Frigoribacterium sp. VKM Ac-2836]|uniref:DUF4232 domain-containing protein n=1 Tax=Frigoribacterium sp. VKM Ac-2836 TaxID=2739014 RepID=UPI001564D9AA|nr:DUF4232 domain-containing protein [Frigoribacterium sp. VKM Ac-2836]NRD25097.1 DUF4232 domain-containing protein [Frigoribacterium sp. VKM Ac-2836]
MNRSSRALIPAATLAASLALVLSACSSGGTETTAAPTVTVSASPSTGTSTPTSTPTSTATATPGPDGASGGGGDLGDGVGGDASSRCTVGELTAGIADGGGGAAGSYGVAIVLTNSGQRSCTLQGWPGVSFVGDGNGTQIGASAVLDRSTAHETHTLAPGGEVQTIVRITQTGNYDADECRPQATDGFRIYPPGSLESIFVPASGASYEACANAQVQQLTVGALATF